MPKAQIRNLSAIMFGTILGNAVAERWLLKASPDDPSGFVMVREGIGWDEVVRGGAAVGSAILIDMALGKLMRLF